MSKLGSLHTYFKPSKVQKQTQAPLSIHIDNRHDRATAKDRSTNTVQAAEQGSLALSVGNRQHTCSLSLDNQVPFEQNKASMLSKALAGAELQQLPLS